jgi:hypothetical protein
MVLGNLACFTRRRSQVRVLPRPPLESIACRQRNWAFCTIEQGIAPMENLAFCTLKATSMFGQQRRLRGKELVEPSCLVALAAGLTGNDMLLVLWQ